MQNVGKIIGSLLFASLWVGVAIWRPTSTFHLAPVIVAAWPAVGERQLERALSRAAIGFAIAASATALLTIGGFLHGPSLLPWGGAALESIVAAGIGVVVGISPAIAGTDAKENR